MGRTSSNAARVRTHLAGIMAAELGASVKTAKRAALLHDVGKGDAGGGIARAGSFPRSRPSATASPSTSSTRSRLTTTVQPQAVEAVLVIAADAISASRPGARGESLESYIKRLETLEKIAAEKKGVERVFAIQAGRRSA